MPDAKPLTDETFAALHALALKGDQRATALAKKLTPDEQRAYFDYQQRNPAGRESARPDAGSIVGVNHDAITQGIANWASTLPEAYQKPAAMLATFPADVLGSLVEMLSAPEAVAGMAAPKLSTKPMLPSMAAPRASVGDAVQRAGVAMQQPTKVHGRIVEWVGKRIKGAPESAAATPTTASAVAEPTIQGVPVSELKAAGVGDASIQATMRGPAPAAPAPAPAPSAAPAMPTPTPAPMAAPAVAGRAGDTVALPLAQRTAGQQSGAWLVNDIGMAARRLGVKMTLPEAQKLVETVRQTGQSPLEVVQALASSAAPKLRLTAAESQFAMNLAKAGKTPAAIQEAIQAMRQMAAKPGVMSPAEVTADIAARIGNRSPMR